MPTNGLTEKQIRDLLASMRDNQADCGFDAFVVMKDEPKLKSMVLSEGKNTDGKSFRDVLKDMFFSVIGESYLAPDVAYADGTQLADNQHKFLIIRQSGAFTPFSFLNTANAAEEFDSQDLSNATGLVFKIRKGTDTIWCYQHLWSIMVPNKKKNHVMTRFCKFENQTVFSEQTESLLTIAHRVDILIVNGHLITGNTTLLQKNFGFQDYIYQSATQAVTSIAEKGLVSNTDKLTEYISRGKPKYAKKMMRIGDSRVLALSADELYTKINTVPRWKDKFHIDETTHQIILKTYSEVESLIDLFDERYTRSDITDTEYDTDVKTVAQPT